MALLAVFVHTESRVVAPLLPLALVRNGQRAAALIVMMLVVGAQFSTFFLVTQYLQRVLGFSPIATGAAFLPLSLAIFAVTRVAARLVARVGPGRLVVVGAAGLVVSFLWLAQFSETSTYAVNLLGPLMLNGASAALVFMPVSVIVLGGVDRTLAGTVSGLLQTAQQLGGAVGLAVIVSVYASGSIPGQFVPGTATAFHTSALFVGIALLIGLVVLRPRRTASVPATASEPEEELVPESAPALATTPA
ncbi:MAG: MFS transporter [Knoellia sp.]